MSAENSFESVVERAKTAAEQAEEVETQAKAEPDDGSYTHIFKKPFTWEGRTYERLTFDFESLTGKDSAAVERELRNRSITVVIAEYTTEYLAGMAARACTDRDKDGHRTVSVQTLEGMPVRDFRRICSKLRSFLLRAEFGEETAASGSESNT